MIINLWSEYYITIVRGESIEKWVKSKLVDYLIKWSILINAKWFVNRIKIRLKSILSTLLNEYFIWYPVSVYTKENFWYKTINFCHEKLLLISGNIFYINILLYICVWKWHIGMKRTSIFKFWISFVNWWVDWLIGLSVGYEYYSEYIFFFCIIGGFNILFNSKQAKGRVYRVYCSWKGSHSVYIHTLIFNLVKQSFFN